MNIEQIEQLTNEELRKKERYHMNLSVLFLVTFLSMLYLGIQGFSKGEKLETLIPAILGMSSIIAFFPVFRIMKRIRLELKKRGF